MAYLGVGHPVNQAGPADTGEAALALHLSAWFGRPVPRIHGTGRDRSLRLDEQPSLSPLPKVGRSGYLSTCEAMASSLATP